MPEQRRLDRSDIASPSSAAFLLQARRLESAVLSMAELEGLDPRVPSNIPKIVDLVNRADVQTSMNDVDQGSTVTSRGVAEYVVANILGFGPLEPLLRDPSVWEISVNAPDRIWIRLTNGVTKEYSGAFYDDDHVIRTISRLLEGARGTHRKLDPTDGIQDAQLHDGSRLHIVHPDLVSGGHLLVSIRKFTADSSGERASAHASHLQSAPAEHFLGTALRGGASIILAGPPGSGKTTLLSRLSGVLHPSTRVVLAEEVLETRILTGNVAHMQTRPKRNDRSQVGLRELAAAFLRMSPDLAVIGEIRDREVMPFLMTLSSGVQGISTMHARSARHALGRLRFLAQLSQYDVSEGALTQLISEGIDLVALCERRDSTFSITEVLAVEEAQMQRDRWQFVTTPIFHSESGHESARPTGLHSEKLAKMLDRASCEDGPPQDVAAVEEAFAKQRSPGSNRSGTTRW